LQQDGESKIKFVKIEFGVTTIVYFGKLRKTKKIRQGLQKTKFLVQELVTRGEGINTHNVHPKTVPLIKRAKGCGF